MSERIRIAKAVWLATMLLALPAAAVMFYTVVGSLNLSGHGQVSITPFLVAALVPPVTAALATKVTASYVERTSNGTTHAGPVVLGCATGFLFGWWLGSGAGGATTFVSIAIASFAGAVAGTYIEIAIGPIAVGIAFAIVTYLAVLMSS